MTRLGEQTIKLDNPPTITDFIYGTKIKINPNNAQNKVVPILAL